MLLVFGCFGQSCREFLFAYGELTVFGAGTVYCQSFITILATRNIVFFSCPCLPSPCCSPPPSSNGALLCVSPPEKRKPFGRREREKKKYKPVADHERESEELLLLLLSCVIIIACLLQVCK
jgi:hypothetical protein